MAIEDILYWFRADNRAMRRVRKSWAKANIKAIRRDLGNAEVKLWNGDTRWTELEIYRKALNEGRLTLTPEEQFSISPRK